MTETLVLIHLLNSHVWLEVPHLPYVHGFGCRTKRPKEVMSNTVPLVTSNTVPLVISNTVPLVMSNTVPLVMSNTAPLVMSNTVPLVMSNTVPNYHW